MKNATQQPRIPQLRFPAFDGEWEKKKFKELLIESRLGGNYANAETETDKPLIKMGNLGRGNIVLNKIQYISENEEINEKDKIQYGDLFFNTRNTLDLVGKVAIWNNELPIAYYNSNLMYIEFENNFFMNYKLNSFEGIKALRRLATGTTSVAAIYTKDLLKLKLNIPSNLKEQQKIATFLTAVDKKISQLTLKKEQLTQYKKGVMQQLFSQELRFQPDELQPSLRGAQQRSNLPDENSPSASNGNQFPDWEEKRLGELATRNSIKNKENEVNFVLTNSATQGIVSQQDYFDRDIANQNNLEGYYIVEKDDFIYNPRISVHAPVGPIKRNKLQRGVMSPLYSVFTFNVENLEYFEFYFETVIWHKYLNSVANFGARHDRMNISNSDFFEMPIPMPCAEERKKIATYLSAIDDKIEAVQVQIDKTQEFKKGLLQQLFV